MCKFSIIIPVYNTEKYLSRCIESVLNQTYEDYEVIIVNNGSIDNSKKIIKEYVEKYPNKISQINIKNTGQIAVRNKGLKKTSGEYVLFIDSHDYIQNGLLKTLNAKTKDNPDIIRFQAKRVSGDKICMYRELPFETIKGDKALKKIMRYHYIDNIEFYLYNNEFIKKIYKEVLKKISGNFFALGSFLILQAKKVKSIGYVGYVISEEKSTKQISPMGLLEQYVEFEEHISKSVLDIKDEWRIYVANTLIKETTRLKAKKYKEYLKALDTNNIFRFVQQKGIEKWLICKQPKIYYKLKK